MTEPEIIETIRTQNEEFRRLEREHLEFERILAQFNQKKHLTPEEEVERKTIQKKKLMGKDRMAIIIREHKEQAAAG